MNMVVEVNRYMDGTEYAIHALSRDEIVTIAECLMEGGGSLEQAMALNIMQTIGGLVR